MGAAAVDGELGAGVVGGVEGQEQHGPRDLLRVAESAHRVVRGHRVPGLPRGLGGRLERAALELYADRGFDQTTVAEIAARAGLTKRTFFNHFVDKPEVLFWGHELLEEVYRASIADAPPGTAPLDVLGAGLQAAAVLHEDRRDLVRTRQAVIAAHSALQEREHLKRAAIADTVAGALRSRGVDETTARLLGETGPVLFKVAYDQWVTDDVHEGRLGELVAEALDLLREVVHTDSSSGPELPASGAPSQ